MNLQKTKTEPLLEMVSTIIGGNAHQIKQNRKQIDDGRQLYRLRILWCAKGPEEGEEEERIVKDEYLGHPIGGDECPARRAKRID